MLHLHSNPNPNYSKKVNSSPVIGCAGSCDDFVISLMPKVIPTLYKHNKRPSVSRILNVGTTASGHCTVTSKSNVIPLSPTPLTAFKEAEYFPMDLGIDFKDSPAPTQAPELAPIPEFNGIDSDTHSLAQDSGVKGIKVKVKRYVNSVCDIHYFYKAHGA